MNSFVLLELATTANLYEKRRNLAKPGAKGGVGWLELQIHNVDTEKRTLNKVTRTEPAREK
jgi:hypothetical protein